MFFLILATLQSQTACSPRLLASTWLDAQWWKWQSADLDNRLTDMGGRNVPRESYIEQGNLPEPTAEWTD